MFIHGLGSSQSGYISRAEAVTAALGIVCLTFDLGGHGESQGTLNELSPRDHLTDAVAALDRLTQIEYVDASRIGGCGASYGGYLAALLVAERPVRRLLLRAPAKYPDEYIDTSIQSWRGSTAVESSAPFRALGAFRGQVLVVESELDTVIPPAVIDEYAAKSPFTRRVVIPGAGHAITPKFEGALVDIICAWFSDL